MKKLFLILTAICVVLAIAAGYYAMLFGGSLLLVILPTVLALVFLHLCKKARDKEWEEKKRGGKKK